MHIWNAGKPLVLLFLCCFTASATAQATFDRFDQAGDCKRGNSSRLESELECNELRPGKTVVIEHELEVVTRIEGHTFQTRQCQAEVSLSYAQNNTLASVEGEIQNPTCGASSGSLVLSVRTANEGGEQTTQEFTQTWMREDDQAVKFSAEYPIGENVDLVRVRALRMTCTCAEVPQPDAAAPPE